MSLDLGAVLILGEDQKQWVANIKAGSGHVFVGSPTMKQLLEALAEHLPELAQGPVGGPA